MRLEDYAGWSAPAVVALGGARRRSAPAAHVACRAAVVLVLLVVPRQRVDGQTTPAGGDASLPPQARQPLSLVAGVPAPTTQPAARIADAPAAVRALYESAVDFVEDENLVLAEVRLDAAINQADKSYYELYYEAARVKLKLRGPAAARPLAERAADIRPTAADPRYLLGDLHERVGETDDAIANFRSATLAAEHELNNPHVTAAWFRLAVLLEAKGFLTAAEESYARFDDAIWESHVEHRTAPDVAPILTRSPSGAVEQRLSLLERLGHADEAVRVAAAAAARDPNSPELARRHARTLLAAGKAAAALALCRERLAASQSGKDDQPAAGGFLPLAVDAARAAGELDAWLQEVVSGVERGQQIPLARALAHLLGRSGDSAAAVRLWTAVRTHGPDDPPAVWALAHALRDAGQYDKSFETLAEFLRGAPGETAVPGQPLLAWMRTAVAPRALTDALTAASTRPDRDFATNFVLATAAAAAQQTGLAEQLLGACVAAAPKYAPAEAAWAQMSLNAFQWGEARKHADAALQLAPGYSLAQLARAESAAGLDENDTASQAFKEAIRAAPAEAVYRLAMAKHIRRTGELTAAQRYYQEALGLDPTSGEAAEGLIESYVEERKFELARQQLARAEQLDIPEDSLRRMRTAVRYADGRFQDDHLAELRRQSDLNPQDGETALTLTVGLYIRTRIDEAAAAIERTQQALPDDPRTLVLLGRVRASQLDFDHAIQAFEQLGKRYPNRGSTLRMLAEAYFDDFRVEEGRAVVHRLIELSPTEDDRDALRLALAKNYEDFREFDAALRVLNERADNDLFTLARIGTLRRATRYRESLEAAAAWLNVAQDNPQRRWEYVKSAIAARSFDDALKRAAEWRGAVPEDTAALHWSISLLLAAGRTDAALTLLNDLRPPDLDVDFHRRILLARCKAAAGKLDGALAELDALLGERALARDTYLDECRATIVELCNKYNAPDAALERIERWHTADPESGATEELRGLLRKRSVLSAANRLDECIAVMERLLERIGTEAGAASDLYFGLNNDLGYMLIDRGRQVPRSTAMIRRALSSQPRNSAFLDSYGWALYKVGDFAGAQKYISRAVQLYQGQDAVLYDHLGDSQQRLGNSAAARQSWGKSVELLVDDAERVYQAENENDALTQPAPAELLAHVREKLAALDRQAAPELAPLAPGH